MTEHLKNLLGIVSAATTQGSLVPVPPPEPTLAELAAAEAIYLGNSLRGLRQVTRLETGTLASAR